MKNPTFQRIVNTKQYSTSTYFPLRRFIKKYPNQEVPTVYEGTNLPFETDAGSKFVQYPMTWYNSNKLLTVPGFKGVKTGIT